MANNFEINFDPDCMIPPSTNSPDRGVAQNRTYLAFSDSVEETCYTPAFRMPTAYTGTGTLKLAIGYHMSSATSGDLKWDVAVEAVTDADAVDLDSESSFDTENTATVTVPATQGHLDVATVTLSNKDSVAAGDMVRLSIARDYTVASNASGDARLMYATLYEEA
jgi:hypothetical protein